MQQFSFPEQIQAIEGLKFRFPDTQCCNCGTNTNLELVNQNTRLTRYMFGGGSEYTFNFLLPFCKNCKKSATLRPIGIFSRVLILVLSFAVSATAILILGSVTESIFISNHLGLLAAFVAVAFTLINYMRQRPQPNQSSYFQPVRIAQLKQEFISGTIKQINLLFTNQKYAVEFCLINKEVIDKGLLKISSGTR